MALIQPTKTETPITPNAVYAPQIVFQTKIVNGKLKTQAVIQLKQAEVTDYEGENETWVAGYKSGMVVIEDLDNLPADLQALQANTTQLYEGLKTAIGAINAVRRIV